MSSRQVILSERAARTLDRMDRVTATRIIAKVRQLADDPASLTNNVKKLQGSTTGLWRLRVGDWRVIYTETLVVLNVVRVAPRGSAYY